MITKKSQIAQDLREAIVTGQYATGSALPSIPDLMAKYNVARDTVRDAIALLTSEGLVIPRRGIGTVVRELMSETPSKSDIDTIRGELEDIHLLIGKLDTRVRQLLKSLPTK